MGNVRCNQVNGSVILVSLLKTTMGLHHLQQSFKQFIYPSILNVQILIDNIDCRSVYCNLLNDDVYFERRANITQSTIYLSILNAGSFPTPDLFSKNSKVYFVLRCVLEPIQVWRGCTGLYKWRIGLINSGFKGGSGLKLV